jgi:hypothetical protein
VLQEIYKQYRVVRIARGQTARIRDVKGEKIPAFSFTDLASYADVVLIQIVSVGLDRKPLCQFEQIRAATTTYFENVYRLIKLEGFFEEINHRLDTVMGVDVFRAECTAKKPGDRISV